MIHIDFANFDEMTAFARRLLGLCDEQKNAAPVHTASSTPVHPVAPVQPVSAAPVPATNVTTPVTPVQPAQPPTSTPVYVQPAAATPVQPPVQPTAAPASAAPVQQPVPTAQTAPVSTGVPTGTKEYTMDELAAAAIPLMDSGGQQVLIDLLHQFGTDALPNLPRAQYGAFATALRSLGAKI